MMLAIFSLFTSLSALASTPSIEKLITERKPHYESFYKDLHENPELSGQEERTAEKVAQEFRALGLEVIDSIGGTGVAGILRNGKGPTTWVRTELDALPVPEETNLPYKSKTPGKMHACGHDFHAMAVVTAAYLMNQSKLQWKGTLVFIGQPAEETAKGAKAMIGDPKFKKLPKPDRLLALHTSGLYKKGTLGLTSGYALANVDSVDVIFKGKGTHGSAPEFGIDPFIMAAEFTLKMQTLVGREKNAQKPAVISVGSIHGGTKHNIIPEEAKLELTVRTYDPEVRKLLKRRIEEIAKGIAITNGAPEPKVSFPEDTDATYNDPKFTALIKEVFLKEFGKEIVEDTGAIMGGEDFGQFGIATKAPSLIYWVGEKNANDPKVLNHSPKYFPDLSTAPLAIHSLVAALLHLHH